MFSLTLNEVLDAKKNIRHIVKKNAVKNILTWQDFYDIFHCTYINKNKCINFHSFTTLTINNSENYTNLFNNIISEIDNIHPGNKISALSIVHFITRNENLINDPFAIKLMSDFFERGQLSIPDPLPSKEEFAPQKHQDPTDGFFIQFQGSTLWNFYYDNNIETYTINTGDLIFIPKGTIHSVESLCPRNSVSIAFSD